MHLGLCVTHKVLSPYPETLTVLLMLSKDPDENTREAVATSPESYLGSLGYGAACRLSRKTELVGTSRRFHPTGFCTWLRSPISLGIPFWVNRRSSWALGAPVMGLG